MGKRRGGIVTPQMEAISKQAEQIRARLVAAQQAAAQRVVEGVSSGGEVRIELAGDMTVKDVTVEPSAVGDAAALEVAIAEALSSAVTQVAQLRSGSTGGVDLSSINLGGAPITG